MPELAIEKAQGLAWALLLSMQLRGDLSYLLLNRSPQLWFDSLGFVGRAVIEHTLLKPYINYIQTMVKVSTGRLYLGCKPQTTND